MKCCQRGGHYLFLRNGGGDLGSCTRWRGVRHCSFPRGSGCPSSDCGEGPLMEARLWEWLPGRRRGRSWFGGLARCLIDCRSGEVAFVSHCPSTLLRCLVGWAALPASWVGAVTVATFHLPSDGEPAGARVMALAATDAPPREVAVDRAVAKSLAPIALRDASWGVKGVKGNFDSQ